jgi:predicted 2-oxoglutarate/Fe(II)-dependent dioxygenase YbiX
MGNDLIEQKVLFSKEECDYLKTLFSDNDFIRSEVTSDFKNYEYSKVRTSYDVLIDASKDQKNLIQDRLKLLGISAKLQSFSVLRYDIGQEFKRHKDNINNVGNRFEKRFKTIVIQLSDEKEYEGGELVIFDSDKELVVSKKLGNVVSFFSHLEHQVNKIINGRRYSIVFWVEKNDIILNNKSTLI